MKTMLLESMSKNTESEVRVRFTWCTFIIIRLWYL